jgi:hypothetical protein
MMPILDTSLSYLERGHYGDLTLGLSSPWRSQHSRVPRPTAETDPEAMSQDSPAHTVEMRDKETLGCLTPGCGKGHSSVSL